MNSLYFTSMSHCTHLGVGGVPIIQIGVTRLGVGGSLAGVTGVTEGTVKRSLSDSSY